MLIGRGNLICLLKNGSVANESKNRTVASLYAEVRTFGGDTGAGNGRYGRRGRKTALRYGGKRGNGAAVVTVAVVLPANVPKAQTDIRYTDTAIYYTIEVPQTDMQVTLVAENDFTRREQPLVPGSNEGVIEGLKPGMQYTVKVEGKLGPITLSLSEETVRTQTEAPKTQLFGVTHECTCNVDGLFHFTVDYIDEAGRWSDFEASLTDARGNRSSCAFTQDAHAPQSIDVIGAGLVGNSAAFVITCLDAESGGRTVLYEAQVKI